MLKMLAFGAAALLGVGVLTLAGWYRIDGQPRPEAAAFLVGPGYRVAEEADGTLVFTPAVPAGRGLLIFPGALIKPRAYAGTAAFFASRGYLVYIPAGPARLSIRAVDAAAARLPSFRMRQWFLLGHSMGGYASLDLIRRHQPPVAAVALWAAAMPADFSGLRVPILMLWGDRDGLMPRERFEEAQKLLPSDAKFEEIAGANHQDFALYTHQFFDQPGTLGWPAQIALANAKTAAFFDEHAGY
jgi:pimeloyl-ACP methyl ester carboxylesterase